MSKRRKKYGQEPKAALSIFWKIVNRFALKYWKRLFLGIIASLIMGGSVSIILRVMDFGLNVFENLNDPQSTPATSAIVVKNQKAPLQDGLALPEAPPPSTKTLAPSQQPPQAVKKTASRKSLDKYFDTAESIAHRLGFQLEIDRDGALSLDLLLLIIGTIFIFFLLKASGEFLTKYCLKWVGARVVTDIRIELFNCLQRQSVSFYDKHEVGQLIARCTNDTAAVEHSISSSIGELFTAPLMVLASFQFIVSKAMGMNLVTQSIWMFCAIPGCIVPVYLLGRYIRKYQKRVLAGVAVLVARMQENFSGIRLVKAYNGENAESRKFYNASMKYFKSVRKALIATICMQPLMQVVMLGVGAVFLILCYQYGLTLASLAVLGYAAQEAYRPIKELAKINNDLQKTAAACERILAVLDSNTELPILEPRQYPTDFKDSVVFKNVSFQYTTEGPEIISNLNMTIHRGQLVAVVGATGSGKSTIANLMARFYDPNQGSISIDGIDLRNIDNSALRNLVGIVSQESFLFNDTIAENIRYGSENATEEQVRLAAREAHAEEFILQKPEGFQQNVGERGNLLSGGQKQRISIARALLKNPPILILDEATSALDTKTEKIVQEAFEKLMKERTVLAIAHRLSTIINANLILVCDHGKIIEQGTHDELYALNGTYRRLYDLQFNAKD